MPQEPPKPFITFESREPLQALERFLKRSQGFSIAFARCNAPLLSQAVKEELSENHPEWQIQTIELKEPVIDLCHFLEQNLPEKPLTNPLFIYGYERSIVLQSTNQSALHTLNMQRDLLPQLVKAPLIFWLPDYALNIMSQQAIDLWSWRSCVFEFHQNWLVHTAQQMAFQTFGITSDRYPSDETIHELHFTQQQLMNLESTPKEFDYLKGPLYFKLAHLERIFSKPQEAQAHFLKALAIFQLFGMKREQISCLVELAKLVDLDDTATNAIHYWEQALTLAHPYPELFSTLQVEFAAFLIANHQFEQAEGFLKEALSYFEHHQKNLEICLSLIQLGRIEHFRENYPLAEERLNQAEKNLRSISEPSIEFFLNFTKGALYASQQQWEPALEAFTSALQTSPKIESPYYLYWSHNAVAAVYQQLGLLDLAVDALKESLKATQVLRDKRLQGEILGSLGELKFKQNSFTESIQLFQEAISMLPTNHLLYEYYLKFGAIADKKQCSAA